MIDQVDADVLILQEVGSLASLELLNERLSSPYAHLACPPGNSDRSIHVAVMSREAHHTTSHADRVLTNDEGEPLIAPLAEGGDLVPMGLKRDLLQIDVHGLTLFGIHLKSKTNPDWQTVAADVVRTAECRLIADIIRDWSAANDKPGVLLGDFNEVASGSSLTPLNTLGMLDPFEAMLKAAGRNPSTYWPKRRMRVDRILLNDKAAELLDRKSPQIHINHMARTASDHYAVSLRLNLPG